MIEVILFSLIAIGIGLAFVFFGYPFFRILLPIWAFLAGMVMCVQGFDAMMGGGFLSVSAGLVVGFFVGLFFALMAYFLYAFAVYLYGISLGYMLGQGFMLALGFQNGLLTFAVGVVGALVVTFLFLVLKMPKLFIIITTAAGGAMAVMTGVFALFGKVPAVAASMSLSKIAVSGSWFWMMIWIVLAAVGVAAQYVMVKREELMTTYVWTETTAVK